MVKKSGNKNGTSDKSAEKENNNSVAVAEAEVPSEPKVTGIRARVEEAGGVTKITLGDLRDELGYARIGKRILGTMSEHLSENGLGYFPGGTLDAKANPEPRQWQEVWIYERDGSAKSAVLDAVAFPESHDLVAALNMFSEDAPDFKSLDADQRLAFIRAAVCD